MIPLAVPNLAGREAQYLQECIETTFVSSVGPFVDRFERMVADAAGAPHGVAVSSGTTGLHAALTAVGVKRDELVILQSLTFIASANAAAHCGALPWLLDVSHESWTLDPARVAAALESETEQRDGVRVHRATGRRVAAVMPVYTLGLPADMDPLIEVARRYELPVVADAAAALGATYRGRRTGELGADLTVFSFNGNKTVTAGGGGVIVGGDETLCKHVRHLTTTARRGAEYDHDLVGYNYRMTNLQAAVGCAQIEQLEGFVAAKRRIARRYDQALADLPQAGLFPRPPWAEGACWFSGVTLPAEVVRSLIPVLREKDIDCRPFWKPIHLQAPYAAAPRGDLAVCDAIWQSILTLPCSTGLSDEDQTIVIATVRECLSGSQAPRPRSQA
jgi:perosamine synthetase